jgi:hypothetical protein
MTATALHTGRPGRPKTARCLALQTIYRVAMEHLDDGRLVPLTMPQLQKRRLARELAAEAHLRLQEAGLEIVPRETVPQVKPAEWIDPRNLPYPQKP